MSKIDAIGQAQTSHAASSIDDVLNLIGEMAIITASFARDSKEESRTRIGAAVATAAIVSKAVPALKIRDEIVTLERRKASQQLGYTASDRSAGAPDPFGAVKRAEAINVLKRHRVRSIGDD